MSSTHSNAVHTPSCVGLGEARSRFLLARAQAAANAPTARQVLRVSEMGRWAAPEAVPGGAAVTDPAFATGGFRVQVVPLDDV
jgi:hypothetical protein